MREHAEYYKLFIDVHPGGGIRRNPKRKNAGAYSSPANFLPPSAADIDRVFENHLINMAKGGTWGDNMEITAFSSAFGYDVKIYQRDFAYVVSGNGEEDAHRPVAHIAYHTWQHYSSIRNLEGPHQGMPNVSPKALSPEEEQKQKEKLAQIPHVLPWMIDVVEKSLPYLADKPTIKRYLEAAKGDVNLAVSNMLEDEENGSSSSRHESSSVERDHDSDDDMDEGPKKRQDRRMSKASRAQQQRSSESKHTLSQLTVYDGSQESFTSWESETSSQPDASQKSNATQTSSFEGDAAVKDAANTTSSTPSINAPAKPPPRLKLLGPRPPGGKTQQRQQGPRISSRDKKQMQKQAQKAARKERMQENAKGGSTENSAQVGLSFRAKGMTGTPPVDTMRTLYI